MGMTTLVSSQWDGLSNAGPHTSVPALQRQAKGEQPCSEGASNSVLAASHSRIIRRYKTLFQPAHLEPIPRSLPHLICHTANGDEASPTLEVKFSQQLSLPLNKRQLGPGNRFGPNDPHNPGDPRLPPHFPPSPPGGDPKEGNNNPHNPPSFPKPPINPPEQPQPQPQPKPQPQPQPPAQIPTTRASTPSSTANVSQSSTAVASNPQTTDKPENNQSSADVSAKGDLGGVTVDSSTTTSSSSVITLTSSVQTTSTSATASTSSTGTSIVSGGAILSTGKPNVTAAAVGAVVGAITLIALAFVFFLFYRRKRRRRPASVGNFNADSWMRRMVTRQSGERQQSMMTQSLNESVVLPRVLHAGPADGVAYYHHSDDMHGQEQQDPFADSHAQRNPSFGSHSTTPATLGHSGSTSRVNLSPRPEMPLPPLPMQIPAPVPISSLSQYQEQRRSPSPEAPAPQQRESAYEDMTVDTHDTHGATTVNIDDFPEPPSTPRARHFGRNSLNTMRISWFGGGRKSVDMVLEGDSSSGHGHGEMFDPGRGVETLRLKGSDAARYRELEDAPSPTQLSSKVERYT